MSSPPVPSTFKATNDAGRSQLTLEAARGRITLGWDTVTALEKIAELDQPAPGRIVLRYFNYGEVFDVFAGVLACLADNPLDPLDQSILPALQVA